MRILDSILEMLPQKSSVQMVADDPLLASELLLLIRMMFADGELRGRELKLFQELCTNAFGIPEDDVPEVIEFLKEIGYETTGVQAAGTFIDLPDERKRALLKHLYDMARADEVLHEKEAILIAKVANLFGYTPEQVREYM